MKYYKKIITLSFVLLMVLGFVFTVNVISAEAEERTRTCCRCGDGEVHCLDENRTCGFVCREHGGGGEYVQDDAAGESSDDEDNGDTTSTGSGDYGLSSVPSDLPQGEIADTIVRIVQYVLGFVGVILFVMIIYGGILYMTAAGNEEQAKKAKSVLTYAIIGIVIVAFSFIIAEFAINALSGGEDGDSSSSSDSSDDSTTLPTED